jgi:hypothetical protein
MFEELRKAASSHPGVAEKVACKGTTVESASFHVRGKAFLFLRPASAMVKLDRSRTDVERMATRFPGACKTGAGGWTTVSLEAPKVSLAVMKRWIAESHALVSRGQAPVARKKKPR